MASIVNHCHLFTSFVLRSSKLGGKATNTMIGLIKLPLFHISPVLGEARFKTFLPIAIDHNNVRIAKMLRFSFGSNAHEAIKTIYHL
jgi:hypothetical protein